jgi:uncharacterized protein (TIGR00270 family)
MPACEMCGSNSPLSEVKVEGTLLKVCQNCAKFGQSLQAVPQNQNRRMRPQQTGYKKVEDDGLILLPNAGQILKADREKRNMRQVDFSRMLGIKESIIHQIESGHPITMDIVQKIESQLKIKLTARPLETTEVPRSSSAQSFTIGDLLKKK